MFRTIFSVVAGLFAMMIAITMVELVNAKFLFPPPPGLDLTSADAIAAYAATMPANALAVVLFGWLLGAFVGAGVAARIALRNRTACALLIGAIDVGLIGLNAMSIPHPPWVIASGLLLPIPLGWLAARLVRKAWPTPGR